MELIINEYALNRIGDGLSPNSLLFGILSGTTKILFLFVLLLLMIGLVINLVDFDLRYHV